MAKGLTEEQVEVHLKTLWASVNDVFILWRNDYRFASEARLLAPIRRMRLAAGVKGDPLKANALRLQRRTAVHGQGGVAMAVALRKLRRILEERFPAPDKVELRGEDGIIGVVTSRRFRRLDAMQRQD